MTTPQRIWVDLMKTDDARRILLTTRGTREDLERSGLQLREGMTLEAYSDDVGDDGEPDDLLVEGVVLYDAQAEHWVLEIDWSAIRHRSDGPSDDKARVDSA